MVYESCRSGKGKTVIKNFYYAATINKGRVASTLNVIENLRLHIRLIITSIQIALLN